MHGKEHVQHVQNVLIGIQVILENRTTELEILVMYLKNQYIAVWYIHN